MPNRITAATSDIPIKDLPALRKRLKKAEFSAVEAAPAFVDAYDRSPNRAVALARGYAATLKTTEDHRQLFQVVAGLDDTPPSRPDQGLPRGGPGSRCRAGDLAAPPHPGPGRHAVARRSRRTARSTSARPRRSARGCATPAP